MQDDARRERATKSNLQHEKNFVHEQIATGEYELFVGLRSGFSATDEFDRKAIQDLLDTMHISDVLTKLRA